MAGISATIFLREGYLHILFLASNIASSLRLLVEDRSTEVLPTLQNFFLEERKPSRSVHEGIEQFVTARRLSGNPITVSVWDRDSEQDSDGALGG